MIPADLIALITTAQFSTAVSKALVAIRAEIKRQVCDRTDSESIDLLITNFQLADLWQKKKDIIVLVRTLSKRKAIEPTDSIWGRWAWVVSESIFGLNHPAE